MVVQHNISAMNANRLYGINNSGLSKSLEKLSSGYAINRAGDNAAGLAVSEKMRAQISGLTQASKNAEDGISMVQTFEGALQETDSILQRMRTLAVQSANGTYQNDVDREAIQLEYDQLNDELNQIADTDFNGVVVLNGGQMADGLVAKDGEFNYANADRNAKQLSASDVNKLDDQPFNDLQNTNGRTKADTVWKNLFDNVDRKDDLTTNDGPDNTDITFKYDATATDPDKIWTAVSATNGAKIDALTVTATKNGGFTVSAGGVDFANVVLDQTALKNGDTITLNVSNPKAAISAPTNAGAEVKDTTAFVESDSLKADNANLTVKVATDLTDDKMTKAINDLLNNLNGAEVEVTYNATTATAAGDVKIGSVAVPTTAGKTTINGSDYWVGYADGKVTISAVGGTTAAPAKGQDLLTIDVTKQAANGGATGSIKYTIGIDNNQYDDSKKPSVTVKKPDDEPVSKSNSNNASTATLTYTDNITLQTGARTKDSVNFTFAYESRGLGELKADLDCSARGLGTDKLSLATQAGANAAIDKIDNAINKVSMVRGTFGAMQNRLEHKIANLDVNNENLTAAESRIRDTDMAEEMTNFTKNQILAQASQAMLAQANQLPQGVLQLLG
ncbi:flagellin N-terminal helical domain-containing protein [Huintestinicola sp.]